MKNRERLLTVVLRGGIPDCVPEANMRRGARARWRAVALVAACISFQALSAVGAETASKTIVEVPAIGEGLCLHNLFQSNMVIQRDKPVNIWGWAEAGERVAVTLAGKVEDTTAADDRTWKVTFPAMPASSNPITVTVKGKERELKFENVLVGDVWVLGGQSNMEFPLKKIEGGKLEIVTAHHPNIRILTIPRAATQEPQTGFARMQEWNDFLSFHERKGYWDICTPETVRELSAIGYVFASRLHMAIQIPIGIVDTSVGGTTVEQWSPPPVLKALHARPEWFAALDEENSWKVAHYKRKSKPIPDHYKLPPSQRPKPSENEDAAPSYYLGMITPLKGYAIKGAIFHQGFNNAVNAMAARFYGDIFPEMITGWRENFQDPDLPFGILSLCTAGEKQTLENYSEMMADYGPFIREAQYKTFLKFYLSGDRNIGFVSTYDLRREWFHPGLKVPAALRIATWALGTQYGFNEKKGSLSWSPPPMLKEMKVVGSTVLLHMEGGVRSVSDGGPAEGFAIAGTDRKFYPAQAVISKDGRTISLTSRMVPEPVAFRYAWARNPMGNIINLATQRSDNWPLETYFIDGKIQTIPAWFPIRGAKGLYAQQDRERAIREAEILLEEAKKNASEN